MVAMPSEPTFIPELLERGVFEETVRRYQLSRVTYEGRPALRYPTYGTNGTVAWRIKFLDKAEGKAKYKWDGGKPAGITYYSPGKLVEAIRENVGFVWLLNGEASIWAMHAYLTRCSFPKDTAANAIAWFGEGSIPSTLADDLRSWGVTNAILVPDCDAAGYRAALKVHAALQAASMPLEIKILPFEFGSKKDYGDLWNRAAFNEDRMSELVDSMPTPSIDAIREKLPTPTSQLDAMQSPFRNSQAAVSTDAPRMEDWIAGIIQSLGKADKREGNIDRWHCPVHTPDTNPSFRVEYKAGELPRPRCSCNIQDFPDAWDKIATARMLPTWETYKANHAAQQKPILKIAQAQAMPTPIEERVKLAMHDGDSALRGVLATAKGDVSRLGNHVVFPYEALHSIGGLCHYIPSGMLVSIIGASGEGKTSFVEGGIDSMNRAGIDVVSFSPEWTPEQIAQRRIQRYSGRGANKPHITVNDITANELWLKEQQLGVPEGQRRGRPLSAAQITEIESIVKYLSTFPGKQQTIYLSGEAIYLEDFLDLAAAIIKAGRDNGRRADAVVYDYIQLTQLRTPPPDGSNIIEHATRLIKAHAIQHRYVGFVASQVTKSGSKANKTQGTTITSDDAMYVRSDAFNLVLTLNREYSEQVNEYGEVEPTPTNYGWVYVDKNSLGVSRKRVKLYTDFMHLQWRDEAVK